MSNQVGIKEVLNLQFLDYASGAPLFYADYAETTEIDNAGTRIDVTGGQGNYKLMSFDHSKASTMKVKLPLVDISLLASLMGDSIVTGAQNVIQRDIPIVSGSNTATLSQTPLAGSTPYVYYLNGSRDNGTALTKVASAPAAGQYSISANTITVNAADTGKQLAVTYQYATPSQTQKFSMKANKFIAPMKVVGDGFLRDQVTGLDRVAKFTIYNAKFKPNFNFTLSSTAVTSLDLELDMYSVLQGSDYIYYDLVLPN